MDEYIEKVLTGEILASKKVILACKRHKKDLERAKTDDFPYYFDKERADKAIMFMEMLPDPKTLQTFPLADFQKFIIGSIYGWYRKDHPEWRRFRKAMISVARKNGKSLLISGVGLYEFLFGKDPAYSRQIFCTANDKKQASIVFEMIAKRLTALRSRDDWVKRATKRVREEIRNLDDYSYVRPLSRDTGTVDGFEPYVAILDEYAASKTIEMMELLESGQGQLDNSLTMIISTAGFDLNAPMHTIEYPYARKILEGEIEDETYFAYIAEQDNIEEIDDESTWIKSNPILSVESQYERVMNYLRKRKKESQEKGTYNSVLIKNFNMWRQAEEDSYMDIETWDDAEVPRADIQGKKVWFGVDVGRTSDLFAISWLIPFEGYWYADSFAFVGTKYGLDAKIKADRLDYRHLEEIGQCEITTLESGVIDTERVYDWLHEFVSVNDLDVQAICFDPAQYGPLLTLIEKNHPEWEQIQIRQGTLTLSMPTKQFRDDVIEKRVVHAPNEILSGAVNNAVLKTDNNGARIDKNKYANKIDALDALLDAYAVCFTTDIDNYLTDDDILNGDFGF
ncbi:terminase large subunit [Ligilactobacillus equi]|uniref:Bacteriophage terminase large subunit n=1 Tax=Ligilactobacillus equi DSM 15833 = JCM 10991 TaxID=1423740 RepID=A0A0R1T5K3_9LACO|nr:terminase TerL endonuclease subunit [Ligilactobacillus equi]KRL76624.1 bacteriophage terminase large subunit [Ligilactobacillus equi DSM 15833 = JCM 10991]